MRLASADFIKEKRKEEKLKAERARLSEKEPLVSSSKPGSAISTSALPKRQPEAKMGCLACSKHDDEKSEFIAPDGRNRKCTDIGFLALFVAFLIGLFAIAGWALDNGEPTRLLYGADSWGNICGESNKQRIDSENSGLDMSNRRHQYYTGVSGSTQDKAQAMIVCAYSCPTENIDCSTDIDKCRDLGVCLTDQYTIPTDEDNPDRGLFLNGNYTGCPETVERTTSSSIIRRCIPDNDGLSDSLASYVDSINAETYIAAIYESFAAAIDVVLYCLLITLVLSYLVIVLMKYFVRPLVWGCIIGMNALMAYLSWYLYNEHENMDDDIKRQEENNIPVSDDEKRERDFYYYSFIVFLVFFLLIFLLTVALRKEISKAIDLYKEASEAIKAMPSMFIAPFLTYVILFAMACCFIYVGFFLVTTENHVMVNVSASTGYGHIKYVDAEEYDNYFWYFLFALLWVSQFILACEEMSLAGCVTEWYVRMHETKFGAYFRSAYRVARYHLGTIAIGSLIIAIVQFMRVILEYVDRKLQKGAEEGGPVTQKIVGFFVCCCRCCLWCLEKCLKFINKNAYIETALYGYDFCNACCKAFHTILNNLMAFGAISFVAFIVIFMIKLTVAIAIAVIAFNWLENDDDVPLKGLVVFVLALIAWFIADAFAGIYSMSADTLLLVFAEDVSQENGPKHASKRLLKYVKKNSAENELKGNASDKTAEHGM